MDKNQGIGVVLLFAVFISYYFYTKPTAEEIARDLAIQDSLEQVQLMEESASFKETAPIPVEEDDSTKVIKLQQSYGSIAQAMVGESSIKSLENDDIKLSFDTKGGRIREAVLKNHFKVIEDSVHNQTKVPLSLLEDDKNVFSYLIPTRENGIINSSDLFFEASQQGKTIRLRADLGEGRAISQVYTIPESGFNIAYRLELEGMDQLMPADARSIRFVWHNYLDRIELNTNFEKYYSTVYFKEVNEDSDYCNCRSDDLEETENKRIEWISHVNQFFNSSLIADNFDFENGVFETIIMEDDDPNLKLTKSEADIPVSLTRSQSLDFNMFIGPNEFNKLYAYDNGLEEIIPFGRSIFGTINRWLIRPSFNFLSNYIGSKGIVIIILIFAIKMLLYPLMYKMLKSQAKMSALKPELTQLKEKYKDDQQKQQMETMKIYREYGVSPLGGCLPMLAQMPIWYALFRFFPASITFRQEAFLWANDLSSYDVIAYLPFNIPAFGSHISLFTILWAISTILYSFYNMKHMDMSANPAMKYIQYLMPVTFLVFFNGYASGLTCYMFFSNLFNVGQTIVTKKFIFDEDEIRTKLLKEKEKPKKKGGFQAKLEEALKQQQEIQKRQSQQRKKKKR
ncbi:MAG: membrane protein insertase YidC [Saprospiraceae bacterium]